MIFVQPTKPYWAYLYGEWYEVYPEPPVQSQTQTEENSEKSGSMKGEA